jgi:hypothetical protein
MLNGGDMSHGKKSEPAIPTIDVPAIHPRKRRGAAQAEIANLRADNDRLRARLARILERAKVPPGCERGMEWEAYLASSALTGET